MDAHVLRYQTDTAHPQAVVPLYLVHSIEKPFCAVPDCWCHANQEEIALLLDHVRNGVMTLQEAADFADGRTI